MATMAAAVLFHVLVALTIPATAKVYVTQEMGHVVVTTQQTQHLTVPLAIAAGVGKIVRLQTLVC